MNYIDIIILVVVAALLGLIIYFSFIKKKDGCANCPQSKSCKDKKQKKNNDTEHCNGDCANCETRHPKDSQKQ